MKDLTIRLKLDKALADRAAQEHAEELKKIKQAAAQAAEANRAGFGKAEAAIGSAAGAVRGFAAQMVGLTSLQGVLSSIADGFEKARLNAENAAKASLALRETLREQAALKGEGGPNNRVVNEALMLRLKTGLKQDEAIQFENQFLGSLPIGIEKGNITPQVANELKLAAAQMASRLGGDAGVRGDLAGILGQFGKIDSAEQGLGQLEAIRQALTAGRGDDTPLTQSLLKVAGSLVKEGGMLPSMPELAATVGTMSLSAGAGQADTRTEQLVRAVSGSTSDQAMFLKSTFGVMENDNLEQRLAKIIPGLREQKAAGRDMSAFLVENQMPAEQVRALVEMEGNYEAFTQRMESARKSAGQGAEVATLNRSYLGSPVGRSRVAAAEADASQVIVGRRGELLQAFVTQQEAADRIDGKTEDAFTQTLDDWIPGAKRRRQQHQMSMRLRDFARQRGVPFEDLSFDAATTLGDTGAKADEWMMRAQQRFNEYKVDPFEAFQEQMVRALEKSNELAERQLQVMENKQGPAVLPAQPPAAKR